MYLMYSKYSLFYEEKAVRINIDTQIYVTLGKSTLEGKALVTKAIIYHLALTAPIQSQGQGLYSILGVAPE